MTKSLKTIGMCLFALAVVALFAFIAPETKNEVVTSSVASEYNTQYVLQDLVKNYEITEDTGIFLSTDRKVDYCEYE